MTDATNVVDLLARHARRLEAYLRDELPAVCNFADAPPSIVEAVNYSLLAGGKRVRPALVLEACRACGGDAEAALPAAAAVELVHTFSLVHDDLPAMDDDDLRRGVPTSHKQFGEATAILAGDAMTMLAFEILATAPRATAAALVRTLARAAGPTGMIGGQMLDIAGEHERLDLAALQEVHARKTGALLAAACVMGGLSAEADAASIDALRTYGLHLGLAFQIADDLLDVESSSDATGKATQKDAAAGKNTYPALLGVEESRRLAEGEANAAVAALVPLKDASGLAALARFAASRSR